MVSKLEIVLSKENYTALIKKLDQYVINKEPFQILGIEWVICERVQELANNTVKYKLDVFKNG